MVANENGSIERSKVTEFTELFHLKRYGLTQTSPHSNAGERPYFLSNVYIHVGAEWDQPRWLVSGWSEAYHDTQPTAIRNIMTLSS